MSILGESPLIARHHDHVPKSPSTALEVDDEKVHLKRWAITEATLGIILSIGDWFSEKDSLVGARVRVKSEALD